MKLINKTHWRTDQLRAIIAQVAKDELKDKPEVRKRLNITIVYSRNAFSGNASLSGVRMRLRIPKRRTDNAQFAWLVRHEMTHSRGVNHAQFPRDIMHFTAAARLNHEWADAYPLERKEAKTVAPVDVKEKRYSNVLSLKKAWTTKLKRAQNALKKLRAKERYYERALAAAKSKDTK